MYIYEIKEQHDGMGKVHDLEYSCMCVCFKYILCLLCIRPPDITLYQQSEKECADEVRKTKYICFNEEYEMTHDPCLVYSFGKDIDSQFERDMQLFSCEVHAFDPEKVRLIKTNMFVMKA